MSINTKGTIPREKIPWFPTINKDLCTNCSVCIDYCRNSCYAMDNAETKVVAPFNCVVGCSSCETECAAHAISFPALEEFMLVLGELRLQYEA